MAMQLTSPACEANGRLPREYTCDGSGVNPPLTISGVPEQTRSLALVFEELVSYADPHGANLLCWTMWNIEPHRTTIPAGDIPEQATEGVTHSHASGYEPPCPPRGELRYYRFRLFALTKSVSLPAGSTLTSLEEEIVGHIQEEAELFVSLVR
jgi:hypothetical protein